MSGFFSFDQESSKPQNDEEDSCLPSLTFKERLIAFTVTFGLGLLIDIISLGSIFGLFLGNPVRYAMSLTLGNILSIAASGFLLGFKRQLKGAFEPKRRISAILFIGSMVMTIVSVIWIQYPLVILIFIIAQILSYIWYITSYIPWGRKIVVGCVSCCFKKIIGET